MKPQLKFIDQRSLKEVPDAELELAMKEAQCFLEQTHDKRPGSLSDIWHTKRGEPMPVRPGVYDSQEARELQKMADIFDFGPKTFDIDGHPTCWETPLFNENLHSHIERVPIYLVDASQLPRYKQKVKVPLVENDDRNSKDNIYSCPIIEVWGLYKGASSLEKQDDAIFISPERIWRGVKSAYSFVHYFTAVLTHEFAHALMAQPGHASSHEASQIEEPLANAFTLARYRAIKGMRNPATLTIETFMRNQPAPYCHCFDLLEKGDVDWIGWKLSKNIFNSTIQNTPNNFEDMITSHHKAEAQCIKVSFQNEIALWTKKPAVLVILGEAPLSCEKYFYNKQGSYLSFLKRPYNFTDRKPGSFTAFLRMKRILAVDIYQYPLASALFKKDKKNELFDAQYFCTMIRGLESIGMIDENTIFVFRYKMLIKRGLPELIAPCLPKNGANLISSEPFAIRANAMTLNPNLAHLLP